ncbi:MAG: hypothetical protein WC781_05585 [Candidatus Pacearchaeota archaeon]|jgi:hypothetical protein
MLQLKSDLMPQNKIIDLDVFSFKDKLGKTWYVVFYFIDDVFSDEYKKIHIRLFEKRESYLKLRLNYHYTHWGVLLKKTIIEMQDIELEEEIRNRGITTRLLFILCKLFSNINELYATHCKHGAITFWKKIGFTKTDDGTEYKIKTFEFLEKYDYLNKDVVNGKNIKDCEDLNEIDECLGREMILGSIHH